MSWIKPSFLWMMYRSGWATKPGQEHILAINMDRDGFDRVISVGVLSHFDRAIHQSTEAWHAMRKESDVVVQWDPERDLDLRPLGHRTIQIGLRGDTLRQYAMEWIVSISDVTPLARSLREHIHEGRRDLADTMLPRESPYPLPTVARSRLISS